MKYYAVTDDPNELLHYGVKGMKWGQHLFGDDLRPKSAGYKRALGKLRNSAKKAKTATVKTVKNARASLQKSATQRAINKQQKQEDKYNKAVAKAQQRINIVSNLSNVDKMRAYEKQIESDYKAQRNADRAALKRERRYAKNEGKMDKYLKQAREGKLKYGKLSEEQVGRITDRLSMEARSRSLNGAEKTWRQKKKEARRAGVLGGIESGTKAAMTEVARAGVQYGIQGLMNRKKLDAASKYEAKRQKEAARVKNKKTTREMKQDFKQEVREQEIREGLGFMDRHYNFKGAARNMQDIQAKRFEDDRVRKLQARINDEMDLGNNAQYQNFLDSQRERKRLQGVQERADNKRDEDFYNKFIAGEGYKDENSAIEAHISKLTSDASNAKAGSTQQANAKKALTDFINADKNTQKQLMNAYADKQEKESAYSAYKTFQKNQKAEESHRKKIADLENENKKLKADYEEQQKQYEEDKKYDKQLKEDYDRKVAEYNKARLDHDTAMNKYNEDYRTYVSVSKYDSTAVEPKKPPAFNDTPPAKPNYKNPQQPQKPKYHHIDYSEPTKKLPASYEEYLVYKSLMGNGNGGKKKNK